MELALSLAKRAVKAHIDFVQNKGNLLVAGGFLGCLVRPQQVPIDALAAVFLSGLLLPGWSVVLFLLLITLVVIKIEMIVIIKITLVILVFVLSRLSKGNSKFSPSADF